MAKTSAKLPKVKAPKILDEFKTFITKGNVVDMAVGIVIGIAFTAVVNGMVADLITPMIGPATGSANFGSWYANETVPGIGTFHFAVGAFINAVISFALIAAVVFFIIVKPMARLKARDEAKKPKAEATTRACPYCLSDVPLRATRCKFCTSELEALPAGKATSET